MVWNWYRKWRQPIILHVVRIKDMQRVHPQTITRKCRRCREDVGVQPSGQRIMAKFGSRTHIVCQICLPIDYHNSMLARKHQQSN